MAKKRSTVEQVQKVLGKPVFVESDPRTQRTRTTLFLTCLIGLIYTLGGLSIQDGSSILGIRLAGLNDELVTRVMLITIGYLAFHFLWLSVDSLFEWRLRVTGTKTAFITVAKYVGDDTDYPDDPRQSTLLNWWCAQAEQIGIMDQRLNSVSVAIEEIWSALNEMKEERGDRSVNPARQAIENVRKEMIATKGALETINETLESNRIPVSLRRFESWFSLFLRSQNLRWLLVEFIFPLFIAVYVLAMLTTKLS